MSEVRSSPSEIFGRIAAVPNTESITKILADAGSEGDNSAIDNGDKINFEGIRFTPGIIEFIDVFPGKQFSKRFTLQNVGRNPAIVRIGEPSSFIFILKKPIRRNIFLASGASISRVVNYTYHSDDLVQKSRIPVFINGKPFNLPIVVKKAIPQLQVSPAQIHFGVINMGSEVKELKLTIHNDGGARTKYEIDLGKNNLNLVVNPLKGTVKAKHNVEVTVEIMGMKEGIFYEELWIKTNSLPIRVPVLVEIVRPQLLIVYPNGTEELSAIDFPPTFNGTQRAFPVVLQNLSGEITLFITIGEVNGEYQFLNEARKSHYDFNLFSLTAVEGRLEPHESRVLTALFQPEAIKKVKGWHHQEQAEKKSELEHVVFFLLNRVHCIERKEIENACAPYTQRDNLNSLLPSRIKSFDPNESKTLVDQTHLDDLAIRESGFRLCMRGISVKPKLLIQPSQFYFGEMLLGQTMQKVVSVTNKSIIRVKCAFLKKMNVNVSPEQTWIEPGKICEFSVKATPTAAGTFHHIVKVQIFGESDVVYSTDKPLKVIAEYKIDIFVKCVYSKKILAPKIGPGITPLITDEVGINKELVTFGNASKIPYAAKLMAFNEEFKPLWMRMKSAKMDDVIMAVPNDRSGTFQVWPKDKICKTIFTGSRRYAPPKDTLYAYSSQEKITRTQENLIWANYLLMMREMRESCNKDTMECRELSPSFRMKKFLEYLKSEDCSELELTTEKLKSRINAPKFQNCYVPLSPMYLSYIVVEPKMINFGLVAINSSLTARLKINNLNVFPIAIMFVPGNSAVTVSEGNVIVHSASEKTINVRFKLNILGRYYGFLNYVINGSHEFKITISAFVISTTLVVEPKSLVFSNYPATRAFQPRSLFLSLDNWTATSISYKVEFTTDAPYICFPEEGVVPPKSKLLSEVITSINPKNPFTAELKLASESGEKELLKINRANQKLWVKFHTSRIDLGDIPLNLKTNVTAVIENECFHDVTYEVISGSPMPGVTVEPKLGIIRARSYFPLNIVMKIPVAMKFNFSIFAIIQNNHQISVSLTGKVVLPNIRIKPSLISMRKICSQSFDTVTICIENSGTAPSKIDIDFKACPECSVVSNNSRLYLNPKQMESVDIMFEPKDAACFVSYVPVIINDILGPPVIQEAETQSVSFYLSELEYTYDIYGEVRSSSKFNDKIPLATLFCTVSSALINVTPKFIVFSQNNASRPLVEENVEVPHFNHDFFHFSPKSLVISNDGVHDVTFCLRTDDLGKRNNSPFHLEPEKPKLVEHRLKSMKATLRPGQQLVFKARFTPKKPGKYSIKIPVYVRGYNNGIVYCYISLSGEVSHPNLTPEAEEIHFYPVPLNVSTDLTFTITADNYYKPDIISCLICESNKRESPDRQSLTTSWLETPKITELFTPQKFQIQISFKSSVPVALRCYLVFVDTSGNYCSVLLTAIADNSSVTLNTFLNFFTFRYKVVREVCVPQAWKADQHPVFFFSFDTGHLYKGEKPEQKNLGVERGWLPTRYDTAIDKGPSLIVEERLSTYNVGLVSSKKDCEESMSTMKQIPMPSPVSDASLFSSIKPTSFKENLEKSEITYPNYPVQDNNYKKHCDATLLYVERWIYEVVMRCDQYFMIPTSFMISKNLFDSESKTKLRKQKTVVDFLSEIYGEDTIPRFEHGSDNGCPLSWATLLFDYYSKILKLLESRGCFLPHVKTEYLLPYEEYLIYVQSHHDSHVIKAVLQESQTNVSMEFPQNDIDRRKSKIAENKPLKTKSSFLKKDWLSIKSDIEVFSPAADDFENAGNNDSANVIEWESHSKEIKADPDVAEFRHRCEVLEEAEFNRRSKQAWLDIVIQIFRHSVLKKIVYKSTIPEVQVIEPGDKIPVEKMETSQVSLYGGGKEPMTDLGTNNLYNVQERMLLFWLNHHLNIQRKQMWRFVNNEKLISPEKMINNFQKDLSDSLALICVTASYCPYIISEYFLDCFPRPHTLNMMFHNASRLVQAWRELNIGLTVETVDIVQPNNVFMVMLLTHLYEILPALHPKYLICFEAALALRQCKKVLVRTDLVKLMISAKLLGEGKDNFKLPQNAMFETEKKKKQGIKVTFYARRIKKTTATLLLSGCEESPYFGKGLVFFLEGKLTELNETYKLNFSAPLHKVICTEIPLKPPYPDSTVYEIWYSTVKPLLSESSELNTVAKPWSKICYKKVCRRLFLNNSEVAFLEQQKKMILNVTIACFTRKERFFWLLFRSVIGDFIVRIKIKPKTELEPVTMANCKLPDTWLPCLCTKTEKDIRVNWSDLKSCPLITVIKVPMRNVELWKALKTMFLKCVLPQEKMFWAELFEKDIGLCIIQWLLSPDEEEEVIDEFIPLLQTNITYQLIVFDKRGCLKMPPNIIIKDVRQNDEFLIPVHLNEGGSDQVMVEMRSESKMEKRKILVKVNTPAPTEDEVEGEDKLVLSDMCQPCATCSNMSSRRSGKMCKKFGKLC